MRIVIAAGIYPPDIGGPAMYAKRLCEGLRERNNTVSVINYRLEKLLPTGIRHLWYMFRLVPAVIRADCVIVLDTFSVGLPAFLVAKLLRKKIILRTGGDFIWELYVERTSSKITLAQFYNETPSDLSKKEKLLYRWICYLLKRLDFTIFSTNFQRNIFLNGYKLNPKKSVVIENCYDKRQIVTSAPKNEKKVFLWAGRRIKLKNIALLKEAFVQARKINPHIELELSPPLSREALLERIKSCYAVVNPSLTEISPNFVLEAIMLGVPFICTREVGIYDRIRELGLFVDPVNIDDLTSKILELSDERTYSELRQKLDHYSYIHSYDDIAHEFESVIKKVCRP